jgi:hypothetical protein
LSFFDVLRNRYPERALHRLVSFVSCLSTKRIAFTDVCCAFPHLLILIRRSVFRGKPQNKHKMEAALDTVLGANDYGLLLHTGQAVSCVDDFGWH